MSKKSLILSSAGLKNIVPDINNKENEFLFVFGDKEIRMSKINAEFISPLISRLHQSDPTIDTYQYPKDDSMNTIFTPGILNKIKTLFRGESIEIGKVESKKIEAISILLWNEELQSKLLELYPVNCNENDTKRIIFELFTEEYIMKYGKSSMIMNQNNVERISSNFYKLNEDELEKLSKLPNSLLYCILSNPTLKLLNEDSLFDFIKNHFKNEIFKSDGNDIAEFYELIEIEHLSSNKFIELIEIINENNMTHLIWEKLKHLLFSHYKSNFMHEVKSERYLKEYFSQTIEYSGEESGAFKGIISKLTEKCGGNVSDKKVVNVTSSSVNPWINSYAKYAVDLEDRNYYFQSAHIENSWLKYDFKDRKVRPTHYSIRSDSSGKNWNHPRQWVIEGSNTDRNDDWKILDSRNNITFLDDADKIYTFNIQEKIGSNEFFRYLRIRQTGKNTGGCYHLTLSALEYFGTII